MSFTIDRTNPKLVELVETNPSKNRHLVVVHIPDDVTDYLITEHDGLETLHFVIDGKIHSVSPGYEDDDEDDNDEDEPMSKPEHNPDCSGLGYDSCKCCDYACPYR